MSNIHAVIYTKNHCQQCKISKNWMKKHNLIYKEVYLDADPKDILKKKISEAITEYLKDKGIGTAPYIKIVDEKNKLLDFWTGFRPNKLNEWKYELKK